MRIADILRKKGSHVVTIQPQKTVWDAIQTLNEHKIGAAVVTDTDGRVVGIISERDILQTAAKQRESIKDIAIADIMTTDLVIGVAEDRLDYVMGIMTQNRIRHLPVMNEENLIGIISIGDVVNANLQQTEFENRRLKDYIHGVTH
jgi:CBS domain-containing protein